MKIKSKKYIVLLVLLTILTLIGFYIFNQSHYFQSLIAWSKNHKILFLTILFLIKISGVVWPPISGGIFTLGSIPFIGWFPAYLVDFSGSFVGSTIDFYLGRKYGYPFLEKIFDESTIDKIRKIKIKPGREIETVTYLRIFTGSLFMEAICYGAGLLNIKFSRFVIGSIISHLVVGIPTFYLIGGIFNINNLTFGILGFAIIIPLFIKLKGRFLE